MYIYTYMHGCMYAYIYEGEIERDRGDAAAVGGADEEPRNLNRQEGTPVELISYINSIFSAFDREVKKLVDTS